MEKEIEKILADIFRHELDLPENYGKTPDGNTIPCVSIYGQNLKLYNVDKIQITIRTLSAQTYSNRLEYSVHPDDDKKLIETQYINQSRMIQVDVFSRNNEARQRFWEITAALRSTYAQQQEDLYNFKIGIITSDNNLSGLEGGSDINRFSTTFNVIVHYSKSKTIDYYDKFQETFSFNN